MARLTKRVLISAFRARLERFVGPAVIDRLDLRRRRFERAARTGTWTVDGESISGDGSGMEATASLREALPSLLTDLGVRRMADIPCGDWNWMKAVDLPVDYYFGGDLVGSIVDSNQRQFGRPGIEFGRFDLCVDPLPDVDFLLCRDVLIHFSFTDGLRVLDRVTDSNAAYFASTTFIDLASNSDQPTGIDWRPINLEAPPYSLPPPIRTVVDNFNRADQRLCIWRVDDMRQRR